MKNWVLVLFIFVLLTSVQAAPSPQEAGEAALETISDVSKNTDVYAELLGESLLKFQNFLMGGLSFLSLGAFSEGGTLAFAQFLFMALIFMLIYSVSRLSDSMNLLLALGITLVGFAGLDVEILQAILNEYAAMGLFATIILPVLILLAFTFRIYQRAYEGKSKTSPFYAKIFNLIFLVFFGVFFIRHSASEEGIVATFRLISGWLLIGIGIGQTLFYKAIANIVHASKIADEREEKEMKKIEREANEKINEIKANLDI